MMNDFEKGQARQQVEQLHQLAIDAHTEGQYATMERLLEHAVSLAQQIMDLPLQIKERFWLADAQHMQGKYIQAIATYSWLIGLASDPMHAQYLSNSDTLWYLAQAFADFVASGRFLPAMPIRHLLNVVADGLDWLERVGKLQQAAGLRLQKGLLLKQQGDLQGARSELEAALALERRYPEAPGYSLASYQLNLADVLRDSGVKAYAEAVTLAEEVLAAGSTKTNDRHRAYKTLAYTHLEMEEYDAALSAAQQCLHLAQTMESPPAIANANQLLGRIYRETGQLVEAATTTVQEWRWARRDGSVEYRHLVLANCARVRNLQARVACGLPATWEALPEPVPAQVNRPLALRRVQSVRRFVRWATPLAMQLDRASGRRSYQEVLDYQLRLAEKLETWFNQHENA